MSVTSVDSPAVGTMMAEVTTGLNRAQKELPCKYFYDERGSRLFDQICSLPEYYLTRTELQIMRRHQDEIAACIGGEAAIVEFGSGSGLKTRLLLEILQQPAAYVPVDIASEHLATAASRLARELPALHVHPVNADYTRELKFPELPVDARRKVVFFPGSTIGNFEPQQARGFLRRITTLVGPTGGLLIGVDLKKDPAVLHAAYNDGAGVTARFNKNIFRHLNESLGGDFDPDAFRHYAFYDPEKGCIEMHLVSLEPQSARVGGTEITFRTGESIRTERSYKYNVLEFEEMAASAGLAGRKFWTDDEGLFSVQYYEPGRS